MRRKLGRHACALRFSRVPPGSSLSHTRLCSTLWACSKAITSGYVTLIFCVFIWNPTVITCPIFVVPNADPPTGICTSQFLEYNTRCTFTCRAGFRLKGCKERVCQLDKSWSGKHTSCEGMYDTGIIMTHIVLNSTITHGRLFYQKTDQCDSRRRAKSEVRGLQPYFFKNTLNSRFCDWQVIKEKTRENKQTNKQKNK